MGEADKIIKNLKNSGKKVEEFYVSNKASDKNVALIEELIQEYKTYNDLDGIQDLSMYINAMRHILAEREQKDKRIQELEEENMKLKAQHIFTKRNSTVEEKAKIFDVIDRTVDTFLEKEKLLWEQKFKANKMSVEEATDIVNEMYQERMKSISEDENTVNVDKLDDVKFTNLEFASVRLLREVQSLQRKLVNSIPKQKVKEVLQKKRNELFGITYLSKEQYRPYEMQIERINKIEQELLEGERK